MCSYCVERYLLKMMNKNARDVLQIQDLSTPFDRYLFLREIPGFIDGLMKVRRSLKANGLDFASEVPPLVMLYRGIEILFTEGFASPSYQKLLKMNDYRNAIASVCTADVRMEFESAVTGLNVDLLGQLYNPETYFWSERSRSLRTITHAIPACKNLLKHYIGWWLEGSISDEAESDSTGDDAEYNDESSLFNCMCPALFFSILTLGNCSAGKKMLLAIAEKYPAKLSSFCGDDLWLQRVAATQLYDLEKFERFAQHLTRLRPTNYYHIDLVRGFSHEQKTALLAEAHRHPETATSDDYMSMVDAVAITRN